MGAYSHGFAEAFRDLTGHRPMSWQSRLFGQLVDGLVPDAIDLPTGLGKTSVMAVWLIARALAEVPQRRILPRRLVYVVDRRVVVDQATEVAEALGKAIAALPDLRHALGLEDRPLPLSTLRGQHIDNREWLADPAACAVIVGTVDMIGSRLLFEGYGVSSRMRPYHAGLLGADTLIVLDEAHLVPPFEHLLRSIVADGCDFGGIGPEAGAVPASRLLSLSATGAVAGDASRRMFRLDPADHADPTVAKRLIAKKTLRALRIAEGKDVLADAMTEQAWALAAEGGAPARCIVYCDSREIAEGVKRKIDERAKVRKADVDTELLVGGRRVWEREGARERLEQIGFLAGNGAPRVKPSFLIATSAGEVGVDLDADHLVCDLVPWERMVQRFGRVNRRGQGDATLVILHGDEPRPKKPDKPTEQELRQAVGFRALALLEALPPAGDGRDASPGALHALKARAETDADLRRAIEQATSSEPLHPALTRPLVDAWSMTSLERHAGRPAIEPWLRGWVEQEPQTTVIWRRHLPIQAGDAGQPPTARRRDVEAFLEAAPPHESEKLESETWRVLDWLEKRVRALLSGRPLPRPDAPDDGDVAVLLLSPRGDFVCHTFDSLAEARKGRAREELERRLAGATVLVDHRLGGLRDGMLDPSAGGPIETADASAEWSPHAGFRVRRVRAGPDGRMPRYEPEGGWRFEAEIVVQTDPEGEPLETLVVEDFKGDARREDARSMATPQTLHAHQARAAREAERLARALELSDIATRSLTAAARLHDEGKRAANWQRAFKAERDARACGLSGPLAKTRGPIDQRILGGYRHEFGSLPVVEVDVEVGDLPPDWRDLVLHLVAAHHGFGRPVMPTTGVEDAPPTALASRAQAVALRFARLQRRWGPWGLAWWEALLRAADQRASREDGDG